MPPIETIVLIVSIVLAVIFALWYALRGVHRGWIKALFTTGNIVLSAALACFLSRDFTTIIRDYLYPAFTWAMSLFGIPVEQMLAGYEDVIALFPLILGVLVTPIMFLGVFFVFRTLIGFILMFVYRPRRKVVNEEGEKVKVKRHVSVKSRIFGAVIGVVNGMLLLAILLVPFTGFAHLGLNVSETYFEGVDTSKYSADDSSLNARIYFLLEDYIEPASSNWLLDATYHTIGRPMFEHMTSTAYDGTELSMETELVAAVILLKKGVGFAGTDFAQLNHDKLQNLHDIVTSMEDSVLMPELAASLVADMSVNWLNGQSVFGVQKPALGELLDPTLNELLRILSTTNRELLVDDLNTLIDFLDLLVEYQILANMGDSSRIMDTLSKNPDLINELTALFEENEHLAPMAREIKSLCIRAVTQSLDMGDSELTGKLTESINSYKDDPEQLSQELGGIVQDYMAQQNVQAEISKDLTDEVANAISQEFAGRDQVSEEEVIDFVLNYASNNLVDGDGEIDLDGDGIPDGDIDDIPDGVVIPGM